MNELLTVVNFVNDKTPALGQAEHRQLVVGETPKQQTRAFREMGPATPPLVYFCRQRRIGLNQPTQNLWRPFVLVGFSDHAHVVPETQRPPGSLLMVTYHDDCVPGIRRRLHATK
jgi:hypothetical protein